jgi:hypothetical protein
MPVQRLPRYVMLLQDLLKHTSTARPDYMALQQALEAMRDLTTTINSHKRHVILVFLFLNRTTERPTKAASCCNISEA